MSFCQSHSVNHVYHYMYKPLVIHWPKTGYPLEFQWKVDQWTGVVIEWPQVVCHWTTSGHTVVGLSKIVWRTPKKIDHWMTTEHILSTGQPVVNHSLNPVESKDLALSYSRMSMFLLSTAPSQMPRRRNESTTPSGEMERAFSKRSSYSWIAGWGSSSPAGVDSCWLAT